MFNFNSTIQAKIFFILFSLVSFFDLCSAKEPPLQIGLCFANISILTQMTGPPSKASVIDAREPFEKLIDQELKKIDEAKSKNRLVHFINNILEDSPSKDPEMMREIEKVRRKSPMFHNMDSISNTSADILRLLKLRFEYISSLHSKGIYETNTGSISLIQGKDDILKYLETESDQAQHVSRGIKARLKKMLPIYRLSNFVPFIFYGAGTWSASLLGYGAEAFTVLPTIAVTGVGVIAAALKVYGFTMSELSFIFSKKNHATIDYEYAKHTQYIKESLKNHKNKKASYSYYGRTAYVHKSLFEAIRKARGSNFNSLFKIKDPSQIDQTTQRTIDNIEKDMAETTFHSSADLVDQSINFIKTKIKHWKDSPDEKPFTEIMVDHLYYKDDKGEPTLIVTTKVESKINPYD